MKRIIVDTDTQGLESLLGQRVTLFCARYIYTGELHGVDATSVWLKQAQIVYETGPLGSGGWKTAEALPHDWYVSMGAIESFGVLKS